jgi:hypothetical protein
VNESGLRCAKRGVCWESPGNGAVRVGSRSERGERWLGTLRGVAIYDRALGAEEVRRHAARSKESGPAQLVDEPGLVAFYPFDEGSGSIAESRIAGSPDVVLPSEFKPLRRTVLAWPDAADRTRDWYQQDLLLNMVAFVPMGWLIALMLRRRGLEGTGARVSRAILYAALLSLAIELTQVLLPNRVSSISDLFANAFGGGAGALFDALVSSKRPRASSD